MNSKAWSLTLFTLIGMATCLFNQANLFSQGNSFAPDLTVSQTATTRSDFAIHVTDSEGKPATLAQWYETQEELVLLNSANDEKYAFPNIPAHDTPHASGVTDQDGIATKKLNTAMLIVSESGDEVAFIPPHTQPKKIQLRKCGRLRIDTKPLRGTNTIVHVLIMWRNCFAGTYPTGKLVGNQWKFKPYFSVATAHVAQSELEPIEIMLPPGEVAVTAITESQLNFLMNFVTEKSEKEFGELALNGNYLAPTMEIQQIHSDETTSATIQLGTVVTGQIRNMKPGSTLPDWNDSTKTTQPGVRVSSSTHSELLKTLEDTLMASSSFANTPQIVSNSYGQRLGSVSGRKTRSTQLDHVPVLMDSEGKFATFPLPAGNIRIDLTRIDEITGTDGTSTFLHSRWRQSFHTRRNTQDANRLEINVERPGDLDSIQGAIGQMNIGTIEMDSEPFRSERLAGDHVDRGSSLGPSESFGLSASSFEPDTSEAAADETSDFDQTEEDPNAVPEPVDRRREYSQADSPSTLTKISIEQLNRLHGMVSREFDQRLKEREKELGDLQSMINKARRQLERRRENRNTIIQNRINAILSVDNLSTDVDALLKARRVLDRGTDFKTDSTEPDGE